MAKMQSEENLIAQLLATEKNAGQRAVFGIIIERYQKQIRSTLYRLTRGNRPLVDDLAQEVFLKAFIKIDTYKAKGSFGGWLSKIAFHIFLQHQRREKIFEPLDEEWPDANMARTSAQTGNRIDLEKALFALKTPERLAIDLCFSNGYSHAEIAQIMDMPLGTVKSHILRGKAKLKEILAAGEQP